MAPMLLLRRVADDARLVFGGLNALLDADLGGDLGRRIQMRLREQRGRRAIA
jgi:hypothetical protein